MTFLVKELSSDNIPSTESLQSAIETSFYPNKRIHVARSSIDSLLDDVVIIRSVLALVPSQKDAPGRWEKTRHFFGQKAPNYQILITQEDDGRSGKRGHVLYQGMDATEAMAAYEKISSVMEVLLKYGSVVLNDALLREIILPEPSSVKNLTFHLLEVMETMPDAHPEWHKVLQVLLHSACMKEDKAMVKLLVDKGGSLEEEDYSGTSPIQSAAQTNVSQQTLDWLLTLASPKAFKENGLLQHRNSGDDSSKRETHVKKHLSAIKMQEAFPMSMNDDLTPFHFAAEFDDFDRLWQLCKEHELISVHLRGRREAVDLKTCPLIKRQATIDIPCQNGRTPLMVAIEKQYLKSTLFLLLSGADPNQHHPITEDTPLHFAVRNGNLHLIKLLLIFDADPNLCNKAGETAINIAKTCNDDKTRDPKILSTLEEIHGLQEKTWNYFVNNLQLPAKRQEKETFIITMDGGGVRAFNMCQAFIAIENRMKQLQPSCRPFFKYFDYIAGTSSGGLLALFAGYTEAKTATSRAITYKIVTDVFSKSKNERDHLMSQYLQEVLGEDTVMSNTSNNQRVIVTTTIANTNPCQLHLMTSYGEARDGQPGPSKRKLWEAARATSAAPYFFPMFEKKYLDGGLMANNPALDTLVEVVGEEEKANHKLNVGLLLSLGTGYIPAKTVEKMETFVPGIMSFKMFASIPDTLCGLASLLDLLVTQVTQSDGQAVQRTRAWCQTMNTPFYRISPVLSEPIDPLSNDEKKIINMLYEAQKNILQRPDEIDAIAKIILTKS